MTQETCSWQETLLKTKQLPWYTKRCPKSLHSLRLYWKSQRCASGPTNSNLSFKHWIILDMPFRLPNSDARMMPWCVLHERRWRAHTITFWIWSEEQHILWISWTHRNNFTLNITKLRFCIFYPSLVSGTATPILINYYQLISMIYNMNLNIYIKGHRVKRCTKLKSKCNRKGFTGKDWPMWTRTCARNLATNTFI